MTPGRKCQRCGEDIHIEEHLCADLAKRLARQERQIEAVERIIHGRWTHAGDAARLMAIDIVKALNNLGISDE